MARGLHSLSSALEHSITAILLVLLGGAIPSLPGYRDWRHALLMLFLIQRLSGMLALWSPPVSLR